MRSSIHHLLLPAVLLLLSGCTSSTHAEGQVRDTRGQPVRGVVVRLETGNDTARGVTNSAGRYSVTQPQTSEKTSADLTFCKPGYYLARRWFDDVRSIPTVLDVTMRQIDTTASPARVAGARAPCAALGVGTAVGSAPGPAAGSAVGSPRPSK